MIRPTPAPTLHSRTPSLLGGRADWAAAGTEVAASMRAQAVALSVVFAVGMVNLHHVAACQTAKRCDNQRRSPRFPRMRPRRARARDRTGGGTGPDLRIMP